jgi:hypothetical protein
VELDDEHDGEHNRERPQIVLGEEHRTVTLDDGASFFEWAHERFPAPRFMGGGTRSLGSSARACPGSDGELILAERPAA